MGQEHREYRRTDLAVPLQYRPARSLMELWHGGTLLDLSAGGFRFSSDQVLDHDDELDFEVLLPIRRHPFQFMGRVVREVEIEVNYYEYGVVFIEVAPAQQADIDRLVEFLSPKRPESSV